MSAHKHTHTYTHTHKQAHTNACLCYSVHRSCVICCNAWAHCLELLWQKDCGLTVWALLVPLWQPAHALPLQEGLTQHCAGRLSLAKALINCSTGLSTDRFDLSPVLLISRRSKVSPTWLSIPQN